MEANDGAAHAQLARLLAASKRFAQAAKHYEAALQALDDALESKACDNQREPQPLAYWKLRFELAHMRVQLHERDEAIALYRRIVAHQPRFAEAHANLAAQLMIAGDLESALHHCAIALAIAPDFREAHYNMNVLLRRAGRQQEAIERYWGLVEHKVGEQLRPEQAHDSSSDDSCQSMLKLSAARSSTVAIGGAQGESAAPVRVSVVCVKWGTKYGAEYVNKLVNSITRHSNGSSGALLPPVEIDFVCLTDDASGVDTTSGNVRCVLLEPGWHGWWNKLQVFSPRVSQLLRRKCVFVDLDTVIVGSVNELLRWEVPAGALALLRTDNMVNEQRRDGYNSSMMAWRNESKADERSADGGSSSFSHVYQLLHDHFSTISQFIYKFDHWLEMALPRVIFLEDALPHRIVEYKSLDERASAPPANASVVCFPLQPKPHAARASWIEQHWR